MNYKRVLIECSKNYAAKIIRNPYKNSDFPKGSSLRWHKEYELIYVEKGSLQIKKLDETLSLNSGEFYFLNSEEVHSYINISPDTEYLVINLRKNAVNQYFENKNRPIAFNIEHEAAVSNILNSLKIIFCLQKFDNSVEIFKIKSVLNNIIYYLIKYCVSDETEYVMGSSSDDFDYARAAIEYMYTNYNSNISLNAISEIVGLSPSHFSKYFKDKTGKTFTKYLRQIRLEKALMDMSKNGVSVKEAAVKNGFPNVNSFILTCKELCNRTPLETLNFMKI